MNIEEFAEKNGINKKILTHSQYYTSLVDALGYEDILKYIPFSLLEIYKAIKKDKHLNNLSIKKWDDMSGIGMKYKRNYGYSQPYCNHKGLYFVYNKHGITSFSQCNGVCILKQCAIMALTREGLMTKEEVELYV